MFRNRAIRRQINQSARGRRSARGGLRRKTTTRKRSARKLTLLQSIAKTGSEFLSALPFVPAPVKSIAQFVAHQFGISSITNADTRGAVMGTPNFIVFFFEVSIVAFIEGAKQIIFDSPHGTYVTNYRSAQPLTWTVSVSPTGPLQSREGFMYAAMFPYTSDKSASDYRKYDKTGLGQPDFYRRAPIKKRASALSTITLSYQVPRDNAYLNRGFELEKASSKNGVFAFYLGFEVENRDSYDDFKTSDFNVEFKFNAQCKLGNVDTTQPISIFATPCVDLLAGLPSRCFVLTDNKKRVLIDGSGFSYVDSDNVMFGPKKVWESSVMTDDEGEFLLVNKFNQTMME